MEIDVAYVENMERFLKSLPLKEVRSLRISDERKTSRGFGFVVQSDGQYAYVAIEIGVRGGLTEHVCILNTRIECTLDRITHAHVSGGTGALNGLYTMRSAIRKGVPHDNAVQEWLQKTIPVTQEALDRMLLMIRTHVPGGNSSISAVSGGLCSLGKGA